MKKTLYIEINYSNLTIRVNLNGSTGSTGFASLEALENWVESRKIKYDVQPIYLNNKGLAPSIFNLNNEVIK